MQREADRLLTDALPKLQEQIAMLLDTDELQERLRADGPSAEPSGWHELKVLVISRLLTAQYALVLTMLAVRIRLNIIGRHYLLEAQATAEGTRLESALTRLTKKRFLSTENLCGSQRRTLPRWLLWSHLTDANGFTQARRWPPASAARRDGMRTCAPPARGQ